MCLWELLCVGCGLIQKKKTMEMLMCELVIYVSIHIGSSHVDILFMFRYVDVWGVTAVAYFNNFVQHYCFI